MKFYVRAAFTLCLFCFLVVIIEIQLLSLRVRKRNANLNEDSTLIYRAYADFRVQDSPILRVFGIRQCSRNDNFSLEIVTRVHKQRLVDVATVTLLDYYCNWTWANCSWQPHMFTVPLPPETSPNYPIYVSLKTEKQVQFIGMAQTVQSVENAGHPLAVCVLPLYLYGDWLQIAQFVETWKLLGVSKIYVYVTSLTSTANEVLNAYVKTGILEYVVWPLLPRNQNLDPNEQIYRVGNFLAMADCSMRTTGKAKYVALVDFDEFMFPNGSYNLVSFLEEMQQIYPNAGSFRFPNRFLKHPEKQREIMEMSPESLDFAWMNNLVWNNYPKWPPKYIFRPDVTELLMNHDVRKFLLKGLKDIELPEELGLLYHLRVDHVKTNPGKDDNVLTVFEELTPTMNENFYNFARELLPNSEKIWLTGREVQNEVNKCLNAWKPHTKCKAPHTYCKSLLEQAKHQWIVYENDPHNGYGIID